MVPANLIQPPFTESLIGELIEHWETIFECSFEFIRDSLRGGDQCNRDTFYIVRDHDRGDRLVATSHWVQSVRDRRLGGLGEVAVAEPYRQCGLATQLCTQARDAFFAHEGEAIFLGTVNPAAQRIYERLGWSQLPGSTVMVCCNGHDTSSFLERWFAPQVGSIEIREADQGIRIPVIPLAIAADSATVLDANVNLLSTKLVVQNSCMGLFPRYESVIESGMVFGMWDEDERLRGLTTARRTDSGVFQIDGFAHAVSMETLERGVSQAISWAAKRSSASPFAILADCDDNKRAAFEACGFRNVGETFDLKIGDIDIAVHRLELSDSA